MPSRRCLNLDITSLSFHLSSRFGLMLSVLPRIFISWSIDRSITLLAWSKSSQISSRIWVKSSGRANSIFSMHMPSWICNRSSSSIRLSLIKRRLKWMLSLFCQFSLFLWIIDSAILRDYHSNITLLVWITFRTAIHLLVTSFSILLTCYKSRVSLQDHPWLTILELRIFIFLLNTLLSKSFSD